MTSQEEWRQKSYEEWVGRQGNNSMGTQANQKGYQDHLDQQKGGGGGGGCFPRGTLISTLLGPTDISLLRVGQEVNGFNPGTGNMEARTILKVSHHGSTSLWRIVLDDRKVIRTTSVHSFRTPLNWKCADRIKPGEQILIVDAQGHSQRKTVVASGKANESEKVYNLIVDMDFTFIADGAVVHSFSHFRAKARVALWRVATFLSGTLGNLSQKVTCYLR